MAKSSAQDTGAPPRLRAFLRPTAEKDWDWMAPKAAHRDQSKPTRAHTFGLRENRVGVVAYVVAP